MIIIGGWDATGGAGILADCRVANHLQIKPYSVVSSIAVQNAKQAFENFPVEIKVLELQLKAIFQERKIQFAKIGMVQTEEIAEFLAKFLPNKGVKIILDTPLKTSSGGVLQSVEAVKILAKKSFLITPNQQEFEELGGLGFFESLGVNLLVKSWKIDSKAIYKLFLFEDVKPNTFKPSPHSSPKVRGSTSIPILETVNSTRPNKVKEFTMKNLNLKHNVRGTGCSFSTAVCSFMYLGDGLEEAILKAKILIYNGMKNAEFNGKQWFLKF